MGIIMYEEAWKKKRERLKKVKKTKGPSTPPPRRPTYVLWESQKRKEESTQRDWHRDKIVNQTVKSQRHTELRKCHSLQVRDLQ